MVSIENKLEAYETILSELQCEVCLETMAPPIKMCILGHSCCHRCFDRLRHCPTCRQNKSTARNFRLENIYYKMIVPCRNVAKGCDFKGKGSEIAEHANNVCCYAIKKCPLKTINNCAWTGGLKDILTHCLQTHPSNTSASASQTVFRQRAHLEQSYCLLFDAHQELFTYRCEYDKRTDMMQFAVILVGGKKTKAAQYRFKIDFPNQRQFVSICQADDTKWFQENGVSVTGSEVRECSDDSGLRYSIIIDNSDGAVSQSTTVNRSVLEPEMSKFYDIDDPALVNHRALLEDLHREFL